MRRVAIIIIPAFIILSVCPAHSQDLNVRKEVSSIDSILRLNPYRENFLGITYFYSIDITAQNELVVTMDFNGPFISTFTARVSDLNPTVIVDTGEYASSMCWHCIKDDAGKEKQCIRQENHYTNGENDLVMSDDICLMLPADTRLRIDLINSIRELVGKVALVK